ncbi:MAG: (d)CMP kinase [Gemmatales bacterium]|nr:(d)CMP kinase [Gemmatales bacterium]MDW8388006.1 (d)CMP kinase [Gemmatales bacterium]
MIVTIDGPAGAGKSTAARELARRLGFDHLDTGAMYRCVALAAMRNGVSSDDSAGLEKLLSEVQIRFQGERVFLNGEDVSTAIRAPEVTTLSRAVADHPKVRQHLSRLQRQIAQGRNIVTEGRDQGTIVFPEAECKFFLTADPAERARRRWLDLQAQGRTVDFNQVLKEQEERDTRDAARSIAPLRPAADAIVLDSTHLSLDEVVTRMEQLVRRRLAESRT